MLHMQQHIACHSQEKQEGIFHGDFSGGTLGNGTIVSEDLCSHWPRDYFYYVICDLQHSNNFQLDFKISRKHKRYKKSIIRKEEFSLTTQNYCN